MRVPVKCHRRIGLQAAIELNIDVPVMLCNGYIMNFRSYEQYDEWCERVVQISRTCEKWRESEWKSIAAGLVYQQRNYQRIAQLVLKQKEELQIAQKEHTVSENYKNSLARHSTKKQHREYSTLLDVLTSKTTL